VNDRGRALVVRVEVANEGLVDLDAVDRETAQVVERRVRVPKSSIETRTAVAQLLDHVDVFSASFISRLSVISMSSLCRDGVRAEMPEESFRQVVRSNSFGERLIASCRLVKPLARQSAIWRRAFSSTQSPRATIMPVSSASGMKASGPSGHAAGGASGSVLPCRWSACWLQLIYRLIMELELVALSSARRRSFSSVIRMLWPLCISGVYCR
jgi:hypothetical protein